MTRKIVRIAGLILQSSLFSLAVAQSYTFTTFAGGSTGVGVGSIDGVGQNARFNEPSGLALDAQENLYVVDRGNHTIRKITPSGVVTTIAGTAGIPGNSDGPALSASFRSPTGITIDALGNLYVADTDNHAIRRVSTTGLVTTLATFASVPMPPFGVIFSSLPYGIAVDQIGNIFVVDDGHYVVRKISAAGEITTFAGAPIIITGGVDGSGATARFITPHGCTLDSSGNLYVADSGNSAIRKISPDASVTTIAGHLSISAGDGFSPSYFPGYVDGTGADVRFGGPESLARDRNGYMYATDGTRIRRISPAGYVTTLAGGPHQVTPRGNLVPPYVADGNGGNALFYSLAGIVVSPSGVIFVADASAAQIRKGIPDPAMPSSRLVNFSVRARAEPNAGGLIVGFVTSDIFAKRVVVRGIGPTLATFGVPDTLGSVSLRLFDPMGTQLAAGGSWGGDAGVTAAFARVGAFPLMVNSSDAALAQLLPGGLHTAQVAPAGGAGGVALAEIYDDDPDVPSTRLVNVSGRAQVDGAGRDLIAGFVIIGTASKTVLIRGIGPTLANFGVAGALAAPALTLFNESGTVIRTNTGWGADPTLVEAFARVGAFPLAKNSADCAMLATLSPGAYTTQVRSADSSNGIAVVEVYEVP